MIELSNSWYEGGSEVHILCSKARVVKVLQFNENLVFMSEVTLQDIGQCSVHVILLYGECVVPSLAGTWENTDAQSVRQLILTLSS